MPEQVNQNRATHLHSFPKHPLHPHPHANPFKSLICPLRMPSPLSCRYKPYSTPPPSLPHPIPWSVLQGPYTKQETVPPSPTPLLYLTSTNLQACFLACRPNIQTIRLFHKILKYSIQGITLYLFNVNTSLTLCTCTTDQ